MKYSPKNHFYLLLFLLAISVKVSFASTLGITEKGEPLNILETYDSKTDTWKLLPPMGIARFGIGAGFSQGKIYVTGGCSWAGSRFLDLVESYDVVKETWVNEKPLSAPRCGHTVVTGIDEKIYMIGGRNSQGILDDLEVFDPASGDWKKKTPMPTPRFAHSAIVGSDGKIYVFGGNNPQKTGMLSVLEVYDPISDRWSVKAPMPSAKTSPSSGIGLDGRIYVFGGYDTNNETSLSTIEVYDPLANTWSVAPPMTDPRYWHNTVTSSYGAIYLIGGNYFPGRLVMEMESYDALVHKWEKRAKPFYSRHSSAVVIDKKEEKIYVIGGYGVKNP